ncbi:Ataxin-7-like protein 3 [Sparganum proliferum]
MSLHDEISSFVDDLIDSCILDGILNLHRAIKLGYFHLLAPDGDDANAQSGTSTADSLTKLPSCCRCVKCNCKVAATRYASHLSNCMGLGRNSSRRANKRIAEQQRLEDSDDVDEPYYLDSSPASTSGVRNDVGDKHSSKSSAEYNHRISHHHHQKASKNRSLGGHSKCTTSTASSNGSRPSGRNESQTPERDFVLTGSQSGSSLFDRPSGATTFYEDEEADISEPTGSGSFVVHRRIHNLTKRQHRGHPHP